MSTSPRHNSPSSGGNVHVKRDKEVVERPSPSTKRVLSDDESANDKSSPGFVGTHIKINNRGKILHELL